MKVTMLSYLLLILLVSCNSKEGSHEPPTNTSQPTAEAGLGDDFYDDEQESNEIERKLITEGNISFETSDVNSSRVQILGAVKKYKGYISSDQEYNSDFTVSNNIIIRIPSDQLSEFLSEATRGVTKFDNKTIDTKDVTEDYFDLTARIKNKKELEKRFIRLLDKANKVSDLLQIEREIARLRSDIESKEGKLKYMDNRISYSTISFNFYKTIDKQDRYTHKFSDGFVNGWKNLLRFLVGAINLWPFILLLLGIIFGFRYYRKKQKL